MILDMDVCDRFEKAITIHDRLASRPDPTPCSVGMDELARAISIILRWVRDGAVNDETKRCEEVFCELETSLKRADEKKATL
jgi:hypothetical protein